MTNAPILVGVDGSEPSLDAVSLAIREAARRGCAVRVVYGDPWAHHPAWAGKDTSGELTDGELAIQAAAERAAAEQSDTDQVPVTTEILAGDPAAVLIRESLSAEMVVVGHRGRGGFPTLLLGSVALKVAAHASCPVLVTRGTPRKQGEVVLGIDGAQPHEGAAEFAFREAALHETSLRALYAGPDPIELDAAVDALSRWTEKYPSVPLQSQHVLDRPDHALIEASSQARLIVLGARLSRFRPGRRLGSVVNAVLHHAECPVAVLCQQ